MEQVDLATEDMEFVLDPVPLGMAFAVLKNLAQVDIHFVQDKVDKGLDQEDMEFVKGIIELLAPDLDRKDQDFDWLAADSKGTDFQLKEGRDLLGKLELDMVDWLTHQGMDCSYCFLLFDKAEEC